jgi:hypothetical protein
VTVLVAKKEGFFKERIHRYTKKSCERFIACGVLLAGGIFSEGFRSKEHVKTMAKSIRLNILYFTCTYPKK